MGKDVSMALPFIVKKFRQIGSARLEIKTNISLDHRLLAAEKGERWVIREKAHWS